MVALRKESVDRNPVRMDSARVACVALRKESVDRNNFSRLHNYFSVLVALRKESVDRNRSWTGTGQFLHLSLSARRAWIEIRNNKAAFCAVNRRSPQGERG